jgi:hypothetical protein
MERVHMNTRYDLTLAIKQGKTIYACFEPDCKYAWLEWDSPEWYDPLPPDARVSSGPCKFHWRDYLERREGMKT